MDMKKTHSPFCVPFTSTRRIDFPLVDIAGIVYYPHYWDLAHRFFEESWESTCDIYYHDVLHKKKIALPLIHSEAEFHHPLRYGDVAHCEIEVLKIGTTSITWRYRISNQNGVLCWSAIQTTVCTSMDAVTAKKPIPDWMKKGLSRILEN